MCYNLIFFTIFLYFIIIMKLTKNDYIHLLKYYNIDTKKYKSYKSIKNIGEKVVSKKLCNCIKSVDKNNENKSIAICRNSIFKKRGLSIKKFTCKKGYKINGLKKTLKKLSILNNKKYYK